MAHIGRTREKGGTRAARSISGTCTIRQKRRPQSTFARTGGAGSRGWRGTGRTEFRVSESVLHGGRWWQAENEEGLLVSACRILPRAQAQIWWHPRTTQSCSLRRCRLRACQLQPLLWCTRSIGASAGSCRESEVEMVDPEEDLHNR